MTMTTREHFNRAKAISEAGQHRHEAAGGVGPAKLENYLSSEEKRQLLESLRALPWEKSVPAAPIAPNQQFAG
jgi:hypothetical protein